MFGLFRKKPTLDADDEEWQILTWRWLLEHFGGLEGLRGFKTVRPSVHDIAPPKAQGLDYVQDIFNQVAHYFGVDPLSFEIVLQERDVNPVLNPLGVVQNPPNTPLGTYQSTGEGGRHTISINPTNLQDLELLVATIAHEICHPLLLSVPQPPPGEPEAEEFATDLATVFFGFGIFGANTCFRFSQHVDVGSGTQGWSFSGAGYLQISEWGFALAVRQILTNADAQDETEFMNANVRAHFKKNLQYLRQNPQVLEILNPS